MAPPHPGVEARWFPFPALFLLLSVGCQPLGGVTAQIEFSGTAAEGTVRRSLRFAALPEGIGRLEIEVLAADGTALGETALDLRPGPGESLLEPAGGRWRIDGVPAGRDRSLVARAYPEAAEVPDPSPNFAGRIDGLEIEPGRITQAGTLVLTPAGTRDPELDQDPPGVPNLSLEADPRGEQVLVRWLRGPEADLGGYLVAVDPGLSGAAPALIRGRSVTPGEDLAPGLVVAAQVALGETTALVLDGVDGEPLRVLLYAFDTDAIGQPLNWSTPAEAITTPLDTTLPGAPERFSAELNTTLDLTFVAPGEDGGEGPVSRLELRGGSSEAAVTTDFEALDSLPLSLPVSPTPGAEVQVSVEVDPALVSPWLGLRAIDAAGNLGPIAAAEVQRPAPPPPRIDTITPGLALAGSELRVTGAHFGETAGRLEWIETSTTRDFPVRRWIDGVVSASVPLETGPGRLRLVRVDQATAEAPLGVLARRVLSVSGSEPFEILSARGDAEGRVRVHALHRETGRFGTPTHALERIVDGVFEGVAYVPYLAPRSAVVAGDSRGDLDLFAFVSGGGPDRLTTALVSGATVAANATRLADGVRAGAVDGLALFLLEGGTVDRPPAFLSFTRAGQLRAARVADLRLDPFDNFVVSSTAGAPRNVVGVRGPDGGRLSFLEGPPEAPRRSLWSVPRDGDPTGLIRIRSLGPSGPGAELRPTPLGTDYVLAHERPSSGGPTEIAYGLLGTGSPLPHQLSASEDARLEDLGFVLGPTGPRMVILWSVLAEGRAELRWTELDVAALGMSTASTVTAVLDIAPESHRGRLGCKATAVRGCVALWGSQDGAPLLFERR